MDIQKDVRVGDTATTTPGPVQPFLPVKLLLRHTMVVSPALMFSLLAEICDVPILRLVPHVQNFVSTTLVEPPFAFHWLGENLCTDLRSTTDDQWDHRSTGFQANVG